MAEHIDVDLSQAMTGNLNLGSASDMIFTKVLETARGNPTCAETLGHREFGFHSTGPTL